MRSLGCQPQHGGGGAEFRLPPAWCTTLALQLDYRPHTHIYSRRQMLEVKILPQCVIRLLDGRHRLIADTKQMLPDIIAGDNLTKPQSLCTVGRKNRRACRDFLYHFLPSELCGLCASEN